MRRSAERCGPAWTNSAGRAILRSVFPCILIKPDLRKDSLNMKKEFSLPLASVLGGATALVLRLLQLHTGFEAGTGLAIPGNPAGIALVVLLLLLAVLFCALTR